MKKLLLASTALVGFAGAAAAEVSLSGYAEIGISGGDGVETQFHNDIDVKFSLSGASDNGLEFGATIDLDELNGDSINPNGGGVAGATENDSSVWVSGSFGKVTLGDTDGALDWAAAELAFGSALADDNTSHAGYYSFTGLDGVHDGQVMRYEYSFGDFAVAISAELDDESDRAFVAGPPADLGHVRGDAVLGLGVKWSGDFSGTGVAVGLGYQSGSTGVVAGAVPMDVDQTALSVQLKLANGLGVNLGYATGDFGAGTWSGDWVGIGVGYRTGALLLEANYGEWSGDTAASPDADGFGLGVNYDLGGGAVAMLGYGDGGNVDSPYGDAGSHWSAGLGLSF
ncbi:MAG: porin [Albidovulum sp.]